MANLDMVGVVCSSQIMPTIFQKPQSIDWGFFIVVIPRVYVVFRELKFDHFCDFGHLPRFVLNNQSPSLCIAPSHFQLGHCLSEEIAKQCFARVQDEGYA